MSAQCRHLGLKVGNLVTELWVGAEGGIRTHTPVKVADFKSAASTIPPPRPMTSGHPSLLNQARVIKLGLRKRVGGDGRIRTAE